ncbi:purine-cytosine permease family protein [Alteromonas gilva]|uniref:Cytosine permease n=1 Tax=Alteromonas gilva TaxID=2987522 RepID=A0ABT5KXI0_9ALTE|nr:cytosine permease [Alteromonas gilva]MDC8829484.1 cytosine permease [Alteromonas gilva]
MEQPYATDTSPVDGHHKVNWPRVAAVSAMVSFSIPTFVTGIELFAALSWQQGLIAMVIGALLLTVIGGIMGDIGAATGKNSYLLVQQTFGKQGAAVLNVLFALSLVGWFGVNLDLFSASVLRVAASSALPVPSATVVEGIAGVCMIMTTVVGFKMINRLSVLLVPVMMCFAAWMGWMSLQETAAPASLPLTDIATTYTISDGVNMIVGVIIIGAIILPDITRFSRQRRGGIYTAFWSYLVAQSLVLLIAANAADSFHSHDIIEIIMALGLGSAALLIVVAGSWVLNSLNLYSAELAISANLPTQGNRWVTLALGVLGMLAAFGNILDYFITFLAVLTALFIPVAGIIALDIHWLNRRDDAASKPVPGSLNKGAACAWAAGAIVAICDQLTTLPSLTTISAIDAMLLSALVYGLWGKISQPGNRG